MITFHQLCRAGFESRMARTGETEDDLAALMRERFGSLTTGDDIRAMHHDGYSSHFLDMIAETADKSTLDLLAQSLQMFRPGPHVGCPTCSCGLTHEERTDIRTRFLYNGDEDGQDALRAAREANGQRQSVDCADCAPTVFPM